MSYFDAMVAAVPTANRDTYLKHSSAMNAIFKELGALRCVDCWGDDVPEGKLTSFPMAVKRADDETVVVGFIEWESKAARDAAWAKAMADPRMQPGAVAMPFDGKRMIYGGFDPILDL